MSERKKKALLISLILLLLLAGIVGAVICLSLKGSGVIHIYSEGKLVRTVDLSVGGEYSFTITNSRNNTNTVTIKDGTISVTDADCPDKVCVNTAPIGDDIHPIICVPNQLIISPEGAYEP